ncbi:MAG: PilZ domain-containing protein [Fibromonadaceae bacterium]|jgi:hypothetical protein|nr:PilZ domain-containing protein [Fibromonadaceae bacterium]
MQPDSISAYEQFAESIRRAVSKELSTDTIFLFAIVVVVFVVAVVLYEIYRSNKAKHGLLALAWRKFDTQAEHLNLDSDYITILREIVLKSGLQDPVSIIRFPHVFEKSLEKYYEIEKIESISDGKLAEIRNLRRTLGFLPLSKDIAFISTRQFDIGEKCIVQIPDIGPVTHKGMCLVQGADERKWSITRPDGGPVLAKTWIFMNLTRAGDAEYTFKAQVQKDLDGELFLTHVNKLNRAQQRNWVRIDVSIPVEITQIDGNNIGDIFSARIIDMSGGGFGMALPTKLLNGSKLLLNFELPGQGTITDLPVKVVRVAGQYNNDASKTVHSVAFDGEVRLVQEQIIQYVFEKQRQDSMIRRA